jgi:DNA mismatch repair protein MutS2
MAVFFVGQMKAGLDIQTLNDLEFDGVRAMLVECCIGPTANSRMENLSILDSASTAKNELNKASELLSIRQEGGSFPRLEFEELENEIQRLGIKGAGLDLEGFIRLLDSSRLVNDIITFFKTSDSEYPTLSEIVDQAYLTMDIIQPIEKVLDERMQVKDDASKALLKIRSEIKTLRKDINRNFDRVLRKLQKEGWIADTVEAFLNDRRVLSVISNYKRSVQGNVLGASNSGGFSYIEPHENVALNNELEMLLDDEQKEIRRIFQVLTNEMRKNLELIDAYQYILCEMDFVNAKVRVAMRMEASQPALSDDMRIELIDAYHPLLKMSNDAKGMETKSQSLTMDKFCRMMVISGPNAGGKSITLKTVGLLQVMVQSGLLVPSDPSSHFGWFQFILSDIGDNQSIENQLSTYSYRLNRMKYFLEVANKRTLLLLDEFGTGSDPELGGALAEVFFETLYNRKSFGVFTTHYANIKMKATRLRNAINASMLFDQESLKPKFELSIGQPGSSFTFEVAEINGIEKEIIEEAKLRLDANKVEMDQLITSLQKEKSILDKEVKKAKSASEKSDEIREEYEALSDEVQTRYQKQRSVAESNNKAINAGNKMLLFIDRYKLKGVNKAVLEDVKKYLAIEKSKKEKKKLEAKTNKEKSQPQVKKKLKAKKQSKKGPSKPIVVGATVRLKSGNQKGEVVELTDKEAVVLFGNFKTRVNASEIEVI